MSGPESAIVDRRSLAAIVCDFDGVLTDNSVYVSEDGSEAVRCSRADGLAFDALRKLAIPTFILSTETNPVVAMRGKKVQIPVIQGKYEKHVTLMELASTRGFALEAVLYVGNDVNDEAAMRLCGYRACPSDAHPSILAISNVHLRPAGGAGVMRDLVERVLEVRLGDLLFGKA